MNVFVDLRLTFFKWRTLIAKPFPRAGTRYCTSAAFWRETSLRCGRLSHDSTTRSSSHASAGHTWPFNSQPSTHYKKKNAYSTTKRKYLCLIIASILSTKCTSRLTFLIYQEIKQHFIILIRLNFLGCCDC